MNKNIDLKKRFDELMKREGLSQIGLLVRIFNELKKMNPSSRKYEDPYKLADKEKSNFNNALSGKRPIPKEYYLPIEHIFGLSMYKILHVEKLKNDFVNYGIRYAAFTDSLEEYIRLDSELETPWGPIIKNPDEFGKGILDYIYNYKSVNGLIYISDNHSFVYDFFRESCNVFYFSNHKNAINNLVEICCSKNSGIAFEKVFDFKSVYRSYKCGIGLEKSDIISEKNIKQMIDAKEVFNVLFNLINMNFTEVNKGILAEEFELNLLNPLLFYVVNYALKSYGEYREQIKALLKFGIDYNDEQIKRIDQLISNGTDLRLDDKGLVYSGSTLYGTVFTYTLESQYDFDLETEKLLNKLNSQLNQIKFSEKKLLGGYSGKRVRIQNGRIIKQHNDNPNEYDFLKLMSERGVVGIPHLYKTENGLDEFEYFHGNVQSYVSAIDDDKIEQVLKKVKELNAISKQHLNNNKVYVHGDLSPMNVVFSFDDKLQGIIDWDSTKIGNEWEDFIYIAWTWLNIGSYSRNNENIFKKLLKMIDIYEPDEEFKKDFSNKMLEVMNKRIEETPKDNPNFERIFQWVGWSKVWVELYHEKIKERIG